MTSRSGRDPVFNDVTRVAGVGGVTNKFHIRGPNHVPVSPRPGEFVAQTGPGDNREFDNGAGPSRPNQLGEGGERWREGHSPFLPCFTSAGVSRKAGEFSRCSELMAQPRQTLIELRFRLKYDVS